MTQTSATQPASEQVPDTTTIRPFQFNFPEADLIDLPNQDALNKPSRRSRATSEKGCSPV